MELIYQNFIRELVLAVGASPVGVFIGIVGALISAMWGLNGKENWKTKGIIIFSGASLCGYAYPLMSDHFKFPDSLTGFVCLLLGFAAPYFFMKLKAFAPGAFGAIGAVLRKKIDNNGKDG